MGWEQEGKGMTVGELTLEEFRRIVEQVVEEKLLELLGDPDEGLMLREEVQARLRRTLEAERSGMRGLPSHEVAKRLGLER